MATILDTMPKGGGGGGGLSREEIVDHICQDLLSKVCTHNPASAAGTGACHCQCIATFDL